MHSFARNVIVIICMLQRNVLCDYTCICNYNVEKAIFSTKSDQGQPIGYMYEFDCKYQLSAGENGWLSIAFEHQLGYIYKDGQTMIQICAGSPPDEDLVTTTPGPPTTSSTTQLTSPVKSTISQTVSSKSTTSAIPSTNSVKSTSSSFLSSKATLPSVSTTILQSSTTASTMLPSTTNRLTRSSSQPSASTSNSITQVTSTFKPMASSISTTMKVTQASTTVATTLPSHSTLTTTQTTLKSTTRQPIVTTTRQPIVTTTRQPILTTIDTTPSCNELLRDVVTKDNGTLFAYKDKCFELLRIHTNWVNAELECRRKGGHLIEIDDSVEQRVVHQVIDTYYHESVWLGLHDRHQEERFEWTSGKAVVYTNWYSGRFDPDHHWKEDCVAMALDRYSGKWEDRNCDENRGFICQFGRHTLKVPVLIG